MSASSEPPKGQAVVHRGDSREGHVPGLLLAVCAMTIDTRTACAMTINARGFAIAGAHSPQLFDCRWVDLLNTSFPDTKTAFRAKQAHLQITARLIQGD